MSETIDVKLDKNVVSICRSHGIYNKGWVVCPVCGYKKENEELYKDKYELSVENEKLEYKLQTARRNEQKMRDTLGNIRSVTRKCCDEMGAEYWMEKSVSHAGETLDSLEKW